MEHDSRFKSYHVEIYGQIVSIEYEKRRKKRTKTRELYRKSHEINSVAGTIKAAAIQPFCLT